MTSFCSCFKPFDVREELEGINNILNDIKDVDITFLGQTVVVTNNGNYSLNKIIYHINELHKNNPIFNPQEKILEQRILITLNRCCKIINAKLSHSRRITVIMCRLRNPHYTL